MVMSQLLMALQAHTAVTVSVAANTREDAFLRCRRDGFFPSSTRLAGNKPPVDFCFPCLAVAEIRRWGVFSRAQAWSEFYVRSAVDHAAHLPSPRNRCRPGES